MAVPSVQVISALRSTAARLREGAPYMWGHAGRCNCGHLAHVVTDVPASAIHEWAMEVGGEWEDLVREHCGIGGRPIDDVIAALIQFGFSAGDLADLEDLRDERVLANLPGGKRWLTRNVRDDVVAYLEAWADLLAREAEARARAASEVARGATTIVVPPAECADEAATLDEALVAAA